MLQKLKLLLSKLSGFCPPPLREILSENGVGSYSRFSGFIIIIATISWVTYLVIHNHAFPDMAGPTAFVAGGQAQYAANQLKQIAAAGKSGIVTPVTNGTSGTTGGQSAN